VALGLVLCRLGLGDGVGLQQAGLVSWCWVRVGFRCWFGLG
jgi:hypothetical protein